MKRYMMSRYFYFHKQNNNNEYVLFNLINNNLITVDKKIFDYILENRDDIDTFKIEKIMPGETKRLIGNHLLVEGWSSHNLETIEIETSTFCNWSCRYCPASFRKRRVKFMDSGLFQEIIEKIAALKYIKYITFHFYNEPTIDPLFADKIIYIQEKGIKLYLATNGTELNQKKLELLKNTQVLYKLVFNIPSVREDCFRNLTGYHDYEKIIGNIKNALKLNLPVYFAINHKKETDEVIRYFGVGKEKVETFKTVDRAGSITNEFYNNVDIKDPRLFGCLLTLKRMYIDIDGWCFICCQDFCKKYKYAHISEGDLDILYSDKMNGLRKIVTGGAVASPDFICRKCTIMYDMKANNKFRLLNR